MMNDMDRIARKDIGEKKVFKRIGCTYYQVYADRDRGIYVYDIINQDGMHRGYEVIRAPKFTNPDGSVVRRYPGDEEFGKYGWTTIGTERTYDREIEQIVSIVASKINSNTEMEVGIVRGDDKRNLAGTGPKRQAI